MAWYDGIKDISEVMLKIDEKIGIKRCILYVALILGILAIVNFKTVTKTCIEFVEEISEEIHFEKMERRDQLMSELLPLLKEFRAATSADRILYFEYHNSKENLVGIPFKYVDLVLQGTKYGVSFAPESNFRDINVGTITDLYEDVKVGKILYCAGDMDSAFITHYPSNHEFFKENDGSVQQVFLNIPGVKQPVGMIVLEWMTCDKIDIDRVTRYAVGEGSYISRINGLIMSKR